MLSISHSLTGAFLAVTLQNPLLYAPVVLASHYLEDWMPHWDVGTGLSTGQRQRHHAIIMELAELVITIGLVYWYWQAGQNTVTWHAWIGALIALMPDFLEAPRNFLKWEPSFLRPINNFHHFFHHSTPQILYGLLPQVALWVVIWWMR